MKKRTKQLAIKRRKKSTYVWAGVAFLLLASGLYLFMLVLAPVRILPSTPGENWNEPVKKPEIGENRVYIPRLNLNMRYKSGDASVLNDALWHRVPDRGNPEKGGNFVLAGHRFELASTPEETRRKSPLYHIDKLLTGDYIYADYNGKRYQYQVVRNYSVKPTQTKIEAASATSKMTLYTCTLGGSTDGREAIEAKLAERNIDPAAKLAINASDH